MRLPPPLSRPYDGRCPQAILSYAGMAKVVDTAPDHVAAARQFVIDAITPTQLRCGPPTTASCAASTPRRRLGPLVDSGQPSPQSAAALGDQTALA
jgi:hypothetical protein